jgi:hypothetical protein
VSLRLSVHPIASTSVRYVLNLQFIACTKNCRENLITIYYRGRQKYYFLEFEKLLLVLNIFNIKYFFNFSLHLQSVSVYSANIVKSSTKACRRVLTSK